MAKVKTPPESAAWEALGADPRMVAIKQKMEKAEADYQRWWARLKRALNQIEKARNTIKRGTKRLELRAAEIEKEAT